MLKVKGFYLKIKLFSFFKKSKFRKNEFNFNIKPLL